MHLFSHGRRRRPLPRQLRHQQLTNGRPHGHARRGRAAAAAARRRKVLHEHRPRARRPRAAAARHPALRRARLARRDEPRLLVQLPLVRAGAHPAGRGAHPAHARAHLCRAAPAVHDRGRHQRRRRRRRRRLPRAAARVPALPEDAARVALVHPAAEIAAGPRLPGRRPAERASVCGQEADGTDAAKRRR